MLSPGLAEGFPNLENKSCLQSLSLGSLSLPAHVLAIFKGLEGGASGLHYQHYHWQT